MRYLRHTYKKACTELNLSFITVNSDLRGTPRSVTCQPRSPLATPSAGDPARRRNPWRLPLSPRGSRVVENAQGERRVRTSGFPVTSRRSRNQAGFQKHLKKHPEFLLRSQLLGETSPNSGTCPLFWGSRSCSHISGLTAPPPHGSRSSLQQKGSGQPCVAPPRPPGRVVHLTPAPASRLLCTEPAVLGAIAAWE